VALHDLTALEQAAAIRRGELSAVELTEHYLARSAALGDRVGAFISLTPDLARAQAAAADRAVQDRTPLGPLRRRRPHQGPEPDGGRAGATGVAGG
jgi:amidase